MEDVNLTTKTKGSIKGSEVSPVSGNIVPIRGIALNSLGHSLGVWNLKTAPIYGILQHSIMHGYSYGQTDILYEYELINVPSYEIEQNPINKTITSAVDMVLADNKKSDPYIVKWLEPEKTTENASLLPNRCIVSTAHHLPTNTMDVYEDGAWKAYPCIDWEKYSDVNPWFNVDFYVTLDNHCNSFNIFSSKKFKPCNKFIYNGCRPYNWTIESLRKYGYLK